VRLPQAAPVLGMADQRSTPMTSSSPDRSAIWLRFAAAGLGLLAVSAAAVSFTAQYRMVYAARQLPVVAGLEAAIPDAARNGSTR
jgi:hypothetical protein